MWATGFAPFYSYDQPIACETLSLIPFNPHNFVRIINSFIAAIVEGSRTLLDRWRAYRGCKSGLAPLPTHAYMYMYICKCAYLSAYLSERPLLVDEHLAMCIVPEPTGVAEHRSRTHVRVHRDALIVSGCSITQTYFLILPIDHPRQLTFSHIIDRHVIYNILLLLRKGRNCLLSKHLFMRKKKETVTRMVLIE